MTVAVTGASGFIGRYLVEALAAGGRKVIALGREAERLATLAGPRVSAHTTDYRQENLESALAGADALVHLAGRRTLREDEPLRFRPFAEANILALDDLLFAARAAGVKTVVLMSSTAVYSSANVSPWREDDQPAPLNPYGLSKLQSEQMLALWARQGAFRAVSLRVAACYGYRERASAALMRLVGEAIAGRTLTIRGNRQISVEQIYVRDVVDAVLAALGDGAPGGVFNIGTGRAWSLAEIAGTANEVFGNEGNLVFEDEPREVPAHVMDISRAASSLGWRPRFDLRSALVDFRETRARDGGT